MNYTPEPLYGPNDKGKNEDEMAYQVLNKLRTMSSDCFDSLEHVNLQMKSQDRDSKYEQIQWLPLHVG